MTSSAKGAKQKDNDFLMLRDLIFPHFEDDQKKAVESIYRVLHPLLIAGHIRTVIDSGCGTGEILIGIATKLKNELEFRKECNWKPDDKEHSITNYRFLGFDHNLEEVKCAKKKAKTLNDKIHNLVTFKQLTLVGVGTKTSDGGSQKNKSGDSIRGIVDRDDPHKGRLGWQYVCLIITGHTLPYADVWLRTIQAIREGWTVPKFIFYDICATFDEAIEAINNKGKQNKEGRKYEEPQIILDSRDPVITTACWDILCRKTEGAVTKEHVQAASGKLLFVRCSKPSQDSKKIRRTFDLYIVADGAVNGSGPHEIFDEEQMKMKHEDFQKELRNSENYLLRLVEKVSYTGGYTPLVGYLCTLQVWQETVMNDAYLQAVRKLLQDDLFANDDWNPLCKLRSLVGVVAVQPFDSYHTYGRYVPISVWRKDGKVGKEDTTYCEDSLFDNDDALKNVHINGSKAILRSVILDFTSTPPPPHNHEKIKSGSTGSKGRSSNYDTERVKYLPSPSLRNAILHEGSVSNVRSLANHDQFRFCDFDAATQQIAINEVKDADNQQRDFFILPVFYGTLPLFCLIFNFNEIPTNIIRQETYDLMLTSIRSLVKSKLTEAKLKSFLVRFASEAINTLGAVKAEDNDSDSENGRRRKKTSDETRPVLEKYFQMVLDKPWYSWADMVPTKRVSESLVAQEENEVLGKVWKDSLTAAFADPFLKCFIWLSDAKVFEGGGHERTVGTHVECAKKMLDDAKLNSYTFESLNNLDAKKWGDNTFLKQFVIEENGSVSKEPLAQWLLTMMSSIISKHSSCIAGNHECNVTNKKACIKENNLTVHDVDFCKLKGVFCGESGGGIATIRFSLWRLLGAIEIYGAYPVTHTNYTNIVTNQTECFDYSIKDKVDYWKIAEAKTDLLVEFLSLSLPRLDLADTKINIRFESPEPYVIFDLVFRGKGKLDSSGTFWGKLSKWCSQYANVRADSKLDLLKEKDKHVSVTISFKLQSETESIGNKASLRPAKYANLRWQYCTEGKAFELSVIEERQS